MFDELKNSWNLFRNMGWRYVMFRVKHEMMRRTGLLKKKFPVSPGYQQYISLNEWQGKKENFFFTDRESLKFPKKPNNSLGERFQNLKEGKFIFFNSIEFNIGKDYDWVTNPDTGFKYDTSKHWTQIADYSKEAGDIKYVWEKSRFTYLYDIIRYDYNFDKDCARFVFSEILNWIDANPINCGPNYRCSQEMSLRVLNWTFALHYYRGSSFLTNEVFDKIQFAIYWQMDHVYKNIDFSRIAVRNNHAITETLTLYLTGLLYPRFPGSGKWKVKGKKWFEEEIGYQIYEDGTFLQFSMNYHRVVVQLLTWAVVLAEKNNESFSSIVYDRARKSVRFLRTCMVDENGYLPNYGANDGALFFELNDGNYRDYRPSLNGLAKALHMGLNLPSTEDELWYGLENNATEKWEPAQGIHAFVKGGYYIFRETDTLTFIRCGNHKDRPSQADNLHLDVWYKGENILLDAGSYKYNTDEQTLKYFMGTASHNTVMLGDYDQMKKGPRFIWYNWSQCVKSGISETESFYTFEGSIKAFKEVASGIIVNREVRKTKGKPYWQITDVINNRPDSILVKQLWHLPVSNTTVSWNSKDKSGNEIIPLNKTGYVSQLYGQKEECRTIIFETQKNFISTTIEIDR